MNGNIQHGKNGHQVLFFFKNGFGASVIDDGYGGIGHPTCSDPSNPLYEVALLQGNKDKWEIAYTKKGQFKDVDGWLDADDVAIALAKIRKLDTSTKVRLNLA